jgi:hypothetical protein
LYRSILENKKLTVEEQVAIRDYANQFFGKTFHFLQLKDPSTYFKLNTLGQSLTKGDEYQIWQEIRKNQEQILKEKKIKHRNFGTYAKHNCGYKDCPLNGIMIKEGSFFAEDCMHFESDKNKYNKAEKSRRAKKERKNTYKIIRDELEDL